MCWEPGPLSGNSKKKKNHVTSDCEDEGITCVVVSYDNQLTYEKLSDTCKLLSTKNVDYLATNPDYVCPIEFGFVPDCGSICEMLAHAVKRMPYFIGKPQPEMVELALQRNHYRKEETLIVGDRLYTDILCGYHAGVETVLVLSGEATEEEAKAYEHQPDYVMSSVDELHEAWSKSIS